MRIQQATAMAQERLNARAVELTNMLMEWGKKTAPED
jgi:hypothetical protein